MAPHTSASSVALPVVFVLDVVDEPESYQQIDRFTRLLAGTGPLNNPGAELIRVIGSGLTTATPPHSELEGEARRFRDPKAIPTRPSSFRADTWAKRAKFDWRLVLRVRREAGSAVTNLHQLVLLALGGSIPSHSEIVILCADESDYFRISHYFFLLNRSIPNLSFCYTKVRSGRAMELVDQPIATNRDARSAGAVAPLQLIDKATSAGLRKIISALGLSLEELVQPPTVAAGDAEWETLTVESIRRGFAGSGTVRRKLAVVQATNRWKDAVTDHFDEIFSDISLATLHLFSLAFQQFVEAYATDKDDSLTIQRHTAEFLTTLEQVTRAVANLIDNIVEHAASRLGVFSVRCYNSGTGASMQDKRHRRWISAAIGSDHIIPDTIYAEIIVADHSPQAQDLASTFRSEIAKRQSETSTAPSSFLDLVPEDFFSSSWRPELDLDWQNYYADPNNAGRHLGLAVFAEQVKELGGVFRMSSFGCDGVGGHYSTQPPLTGRPESRALPGTTFVVVLPLKPSLLAPETAPPDVLESMIDHHFKLYLECPLAQDITDVVLSGLHQDLLATGAATNSPQASPSQRLIISPVKEQAYLALAAALRQGFADVTDIKRPLQLDAKRVADLLERFGFDGGEIALKAVQVATHQHKETKPSLILYRCPATFMQSYSAQMWAHTRVVIQASPHGGVHDRFHCVLVGADDWDTAVVFAHDNPSDTTYLTREWRRRRGVPLKLPSRQLHDPTTWDVSGRADPDSGNLVPDQNFHHAKPPELPPYEMLCVFPADPEVQYSEDSINLTVFEHHAAAVFNRPLGLQARSGSLIENTHVRLGSTIHVDKFYEAELFFHNPVFAHRFAFLLARHLIRNAALSKEEPVLIYGYATYSEFTVITLCGFLLDMGYSPVYAIHERGLLDGNDTRHNLRFGTDKPDRAFQALIIVPLGSTMKTTAKMRASLAQWSSMNGPSATSFTCFTLVSLGSTAKSYNDNQRLYTKDIGRRVLMPVASEITPEEASQPSEHTTNQSPNGSSEIYFFVELDSHFHFPYGDTAECNELTVIASSPNRSTRKGHLPGPNAQPVPSGSTPSTTRQSCELCFPPYDLRDEHPLIEVNTDSTIPRQAFNPPNHNYTTIDALEEYLASRLAPDVLQAHEKELQPLKETVWVGHWERGHNHFDAYLETEAFLADPQVRDLVSHWLKEKVRKQLLSKETRSPVYDILMAPEHFSNGRFIHLVNDKVFGGSAHIIRFDDDGEFRSTFLAKHAHLRNFLTGYGLVRIHFVDDILNTGRTLHRARVLVRSLLDPDTVDRDNDYRAESGGLTGPTIRFCDTAIVLIDRSSLRHSDKSTGAQVFARWYLEHSLGLHAGLCHPCTRGKVLERSRKQVATFGLIQYFDDRIKSNKCHQPAYSEFERRKGDRDYQDYRIRSWRRFVCGEIAMKVITPLLGQPEAHDSNQHSATELVRIAITGLLKADWDLHVGTSSTSGLGDTKDARERFFSYLAVLSRPSPSAHGPIRRTVFALMLSFLHSLVADEDSLGDDFRDLKPILESFKSNTDHLYDLVRFLMSRLADLGSTYIFRPRYARQLHRFVEGTFPDKYTEFLRNHLGVAKSCLATTFDTSRSAWLDRQLIRFFDTTQPDSDSTRDHLRFWELLAIENNRVFYSAIRHIQTRLNHLIPEESTETIIHALESPDLLSGNGTLSVIASEVKALFRVQGWEHDDFVLENFANRLSDYGLMDQAPDNPGAKELSEDGLRFVLGPALLLHYLGNEDLFRRLITSPDAQSVGPDISYSRIARLLCAALQADSVRIVLDAQPAPPTGQARSQNLSWLQLAAARRPGQSSNEKWTTSPVLTQGDTDRLEELFRRVEWTGYRLETNEPTIDFLWQVSEHDLALTESMASTIETRPADLSHLDGGTAPEGEPTQAEQRPILVWAQFPATAAAELLIPRIRNVMMMRHTFHERAFDPKQSRAVAQLLRHAEATHRLSSILSVTHGDGDDTEMIWDELVEPSSERVCPIKSGNCSAAGIADVLNPTEQQPVLPLRECKARGHAIKTMSDQAASKIYALSETEQLEDGPTRSVQLALPRCFLQVDRNNRGHPTEAPAYRGHLELDNFPDELKFTPLDSAQLIRCPNALTRSDMSMIIQAAISNGVGNHRHGAEVTSGQHRPSVVCDDPRLPPNETYIVYLGKTASGYLGIANRFWLHGRQTAEDARKKAQSYLSHQQKPTLPKPGDHSASSPAGLVLWSLGAISRVVANSDPFVAIVPVADRIRTNGVPPISEGSAPDSATKDPGKLHYFCLHLPLLEGGSDS